MNGKKAKLARRKTKELSKMPEFKGKEKQLLKAMKKAVHAGLLLVLITFMSFSAYAETLIVPAMGTLPKEFKSKMTQAGYPIVYRAEEVEEGIFGYCEYTGAEYRIHTIKSVEEKQMMDVLKIWSK